MNEGRFCLAQEILATDSCESKQSSKATIVTRVRLFSTGIPTRSSAQNVKLNCRMHTQLAHQRNTN